MRSYILVSQVLPRKHLYLSETLDGLAVHHDQTCQLSIRMRPLGFSTTTVKFLLDSTQIAVTTQSARMLNPTDSP